MYDLFATINSLTCAIIYSLNPIFQKEFVVSDKLFESAMFYLEIYDCDDKRTGYVLLVHLEVASISHTMFFLKTHLRFFYQRFEEA